MRTLLILGATLAPALLPAAPPKEAVRNDVPSLAEPWQNHGGTQPGKDGNPNGSIEFDLGVRTSENGVAPVFDFRFEVDPPHGPADAVRAWLRQIAPKRSQDTTMSLIAPRGGLGLQQHLVSKTAPHVERNPGLRIGRK